MHSNEIKREYSTIRNMRNMIGLNAWQNALQMHQSGIRNSSKNEQFDLNIYNARNLKFQQPTNWLGEWLFTRKQEKDEKDEKERIKRNTTVIVVVVVVKSRRNCAQFEWCFAKTTIITHKFTYRYECRCASSCPIFDGIFCHKIRTGMVWCRCESANVWIVYSIV